MENGLSDVASGLRGKFVMVTGGAGFVGSELVRQLCAAGSYVLVVDNLVNGRRENLAELPPAQVRLEVADIRDDLRMARLLQEVSVVYHLACLGVRHSLHAPFENHEVNATGTLKLLLGARAAGVRRFVYTSSAEVYGNPLRTPIDEEHPNLPTNAYGAAKLAGEAHARAFFTTYGFPAVIVRLFNSYGPRCHHEGDCGEVIPRFLLHCMAGAPMVIFGDGSQTRDFNYISDTARAVLLAGLVEPAVGQTFNVGSGVDYSINQLAAEIAKVVGRSQADVVHDAPRPADLMQLRADSTKAQRVLGYKPTVTLAEGLARLKAWYLALKRPPKALLEEIVLHNWDEKERPGVGARAG